MSRLRGIHTCTYYNRMRPSANQQDRKIWTLGVKSWICHNDTTGYCVWSYSVNWSTRIFWVGEDVHTKFEAFYVLSVLFNAAIPLLCLVTNLVHPWIMSACWFGCRSERCWDSESSQGVDLPWNERAVIIVGWTADLVTTTATCTESVAGVK